MGAFAEAERQDAADALAFLCTSPYDVRLAQERFPKIHFHLLREHAGEDLTQQPRRRSAAITP